MRSVQSFAPAALLCTALVACQSRSATEAPPVARHTYAPAVPQRTLHFPADHGPHRDSALEWWYFTGHILSPNTDELAGFEVTVFRLSPAAGQLAAAPAAQRPEQASFLSLHVAVTDLKGRTFRHQTLGLRERTGVAVITTQPPLSIVLPGAEITMSPDGQGFHIKAALTDASGQPLSVDATLSSAKPVTLHGAAGYSRKGDCPSCASYYASFPRLNGTATVRSAGGERSGPAQAWFDHEFGSEVLSGGLTGWDWLALQLTDGWDLMVARTRDSAGQTARLAGTLISPQGEVTALTDKDLRITASGTFVSPHTGAAYPARWQLQVSSSVHPLAAELVPKLADQEIAGDASALATYWEGTCDVLVGGRSVGTSYVEMTGYDHSDPLHL